MAIYVIPYFERFELLHQEELDYLNSSEISLTEKIFSMADMLQLTDEDILHRKRVAGDIVDMLHPYYPDCMVIIFGSSMNGFGCRGCDLDLLFLPFTEYSNLDFNGKGNAAVPSPYHILKGHYSKEQLLCMDEVSHLKFAQRVMFSKRNYFKRVTFIPAKCPILNIEIFKSDFTCDFSASNRLVVNNTDLLWLFGKFDYRVKPLVIVLRYWAKSLGFISKIHLSSYAFTLMVIFFLQNTDPPILPSVKQLIELAGYHRVIDGWETALCDDGSHIFQSSNSSSVDELFVQFLEFYWSFDFVQNVVSPYLGKPLPIRDLKESADERIKDFLVTSFSIQDAFVLSRNISRNASMKTSFKLSLLIAKKHVLKQNFKFQLLFDSSFFQQKIDEMCAVYEIDIPNVMSFTLQLNYDLCKLGITSHFVPWYIKACKTVLDVLQYGLLAECEVVDKVNWNMKLPFCPSDKRKSFDDRINLELIMSIQCRFHFCVLLSRNKVKDSDVEDLVNDDGFSETLWKLFKISKRLLEKETSATPTLWLMCDCYRFSCKEITDIVVIFTPLEDHPIFKDKKSQLKAIVEKNVKSILKED